MDEFREEIEVEVEEVIEEEIIEEEETVETAAEPRQYIGKASSTEKDPSSSSSFSFWVQPGVILNPFDYVSVENQENSRTIGVIKEIIAPTDAPSHLTNFVSSNFGDPQAEDATHRVTSVIAKASVVGNTGMESPYSRTGRKPVWYPVLSNAPVSFADAHEIAIALGMDTIEEQYRIPVGVLIGTGTGPIPLYLDSRYILGPEAAHVNASGISGLAAKTSYLMFLLKSVMHLYPKETAAIVFNVKQRDLLFIDEPPANGALDAFDNEMYRVLGIPVQPFSDVRYYLPYRYRDVTALYPYGGKIVNYYAYALEDVYDRLDLLMAEVDDPQYTIASVIGYIADSYSVNPSQNKLVFNKPVNVGSVHIQANTQVRDWRELKFFDDYPKEVVGAASTAGSIVGRFKRHLSRLTRGDVFIPSTVKSTRLHNLNIVYIGDEIRTSLRPGRIFVIDIQPFEDRTELQGFIIGDVMRTVKEICRENREALPKNLIILIDELNRYAPSSGKTNSLAREIIDMARVGRGEGISLFTAQQFRADVHHQIHENCATTVLGIAGTTELARPAYDYLDRETKNSITNLAPGEMILTSRRLKQPAKINFPKPPIRRQQD